MYEWKDIEVEIEKYFKGVIVKKQRLCSFQRFRIT